MIMLLAFVSAMCFVFAIAISNVQFTKAATEVQAQFSIANSAQVYIGPQEDSTGIRFTAKMNKQWFDTEIAKAGSQTPIYFGIELSVDGNKETALDFCYTASQDGISGFRGVAFNSSALTEEYAYTASLMYNKKTLANDLYPKYESSYDSVEAFMESDLFERYMQAAYRTEITAQAYYQVGGTETAKEYVGSTVTCSILGVGSKVYANWDGEDDSLANAETGEFLLVGKYFATASKSDALVYLQEDGQIIGYNAFDANDLVYLNANLVEIEEFETGKFKIKDLSCLGDIDVRDKKVVTIGTISEDGALTTIQANYVTMVIDEASDFEVFNLDETYMLKDGSSIGEVVNGYYVMTEDIDAEGTNLGLDHTFSSRYNVSNGILLNGFTGVFDGQGHVIKNFVPGVGGLFGRLAQGSSVSGIGFYNATLARNTNLIAYNGNSFYKIDNSKIPADEAQTTYGGMTLLERNNLIKDRTTYVNINNIYAQLSSATTDVNGVITKNDQYDSEIKHDNIVIDASKCTVGETYSFFLHDSGAMMNGGYLSNIVVITNKGAFRANASNKFYGGNQGKEAGAGVIVSDKLFVYDSYYAFVSDAEIAATFKNSVWNNQNGVFFKALEEQLVKDYIYLKDDAGTLYVSDVETDNTQLALTAVDVYGNALTITDFTSSDNTVIDCVDGAIKVVNYAIGEYTVLFNVLVGEQPIVCNVTIKLVGEIINVASEAIYDSAENKVYYTDAQGETVIVDGDVFYVDSASNEYALSANSLNYWSKTAFTYAYNKNWVDHWGMFNSATPNIDGVETSPVITYSATNDEYTGVKVKVNQGSKLYVFENTILATAVIDSGKELKEIFNKADNRVDSTGKVYNHSGAPYDTATVVYGNITKGLYMLADDIDADKTKEDGFKFTNSYFNFFEGVFDGRGHNISNLDVSATGVDGDYGNGLFSAISCFSSIQNVGFINVKADNGSVFMGNLADRTNGTYINSPLYRAQVGLTGDSDDITTVLHSVFRKGGQYGLNNWSNVYVKVSSDTSKLMGVISRNMPMSVGTVRGNNFVIEYNPTDKSAYTDYTNGHYGVLFGSAYSLSAGGTYANSYYDTPTGYVIKDTAPGTHKYYAIESVATPAWGNTGKVLNYSFGFAYNTSAAHKTYVISPIKLVSSVSGAILGTNEQGETNKFVPHDSNSCLMRFDDMTTATNLTKANLNSYLSNTVGFDRYWTVNANGYMVWNNA